ncbi:MAG: toll/interleukin-1 receptor domain-containing protein, partial [Verrucomicrobiota bacterium]
MSSIFISHASSDKKTAEQLKKDLEELGHEIWIDYSKIDVGENLKDEIYKGLSDCDFLVVIFSRTSVDSDWVKEEWTQKCDEEETSGRVMVFPAVIEHVEIPLRLSNRRYADLHSSYLRGLFDLHRAIEKNDDHVLKPTESGSVFAVPKPQGISDFLT